MTATQGASDQILESVRAILAAQGLTPQELVAHSERAAPDREALAPNYTRLRQRIARMERGLSKNTKCTWKTHLDRLIDGTPEVCECLCDALSGVAL